MNRASSSPDNTPPAGASAPARPGYRNIYLWLVILIPAASVILGVALVWIAVVNADDTVDDNWYKEGRTINRTMEDEARARQFGIAVEIDFASERPQARMFSAVPVPFPETLEVRLRHPAFQAQDRTFVLEHQADGRYLADRAVDVHSDMHAIVAPPDGHWRLQQRVEIEGAPVVISMTSLAE